MNILRFLLSVVVVSSWITLAAGTIREITEDRARESFSECVDRYAQHVRQTLNDEQEIVKLLRSLFSVRQLPMATVLGVLKKLDGLGIKQDQGDQAVQEVYCAVMLKLLASCVEAAQQEIFHILYELDQAVEYWEYQRLHPVSYFFKKLPIKHVTSGQQDEVDGAIQRVRDERQRQLVLVGNMMVHVSTFDEHKTVQEQYSWMNELCAVITAWHRDTHVNNQDMMSSVALRRTVNVIGDYRTHMHKSLYRFLMPPWILRHWLYLCGAAMGIAYKTSRTTYTYDDLGRYRKTATDHISREFQKQKNNYKEAFFGDPYAESVLRKDYVAAVELFRDGIGEAQLRASGFGNLWEILPPIDELRKDDVQPDAQVVSRMFDYWSRALGEIGVALSNAGINLTNIINTCSGNIENASIKSSEIWNNGVNSEYTSTVPGLTNINKAIAILKIVLSSIQEVSKDVKANDSLAKALKKINKVIGYRGQPDEQKEKKDTVSLKSDENNNSSVDTKSNSPSITQSNNNGDVIHKNVEQEHSSGGWVSWGKTLMSSYWYGSGAENGQGAANPSNTQSAEQNKAQIGNASSNSNGQNIKKQGVHDGKQEVENSASINVTSNKSKPSPFFLFQIPSLHLKMQAKEHRMFWAILYSMPPVAALCFVGWGINKLYRKMRGNPNYDSVRATLADISLLLNTYGDAHPKDMDVGDLGRLMYLIHKIELQKFCVPKQYQDAFMVDTSVLKSTALHAAQKLRVIDVLFKKYPFLGHAEMVAPV